MEMLFEQMVPPNSALVSNQVLVFALGLVSALEQMLPRRRAVRVVVLSQEVMGPQLLMLVHPPRVVEDMFEVVPVPEVVVAMRSILAVRTYERSCHTCSCTGSTYTSSHMSAGTNMCTGCTENIVSSRMVL